jgi:hypothetical protein
LKEKYFVFGLMLAIWGASLFIPKTITSGYHFADDHEIISFSHKLSETETTFPSLVRTQLIKDTNIRFRPFYYLHRIFLCSFLGNNFVLWHIYNWLLAGLTSFLLYMFASNIGFRPLEGALIALLPFLGEQGEIWWRLGPNETIGICMLSLCLFYMGRCALAPAVKWYDNVFFLVFAILTTLSKESFILCLPAIVFWYHALKKSQNERNWMKTIADNLTISVLLLIGFFEILFIIFFVGTANVGYAGVDIISPAHILDAAKDLIFRNGLGEAIIIGLLISVIVSGRNRTRMLRKLGALAALLFIWILPQIVLYAKTGMSSRYLLPATIGLSVFSAYLWERRFNSLPDSPVDFYSNNNVNSLPLPIFFHLIP